MASVRLLNRCAHVPMELDWAEGQFFESSGLYLMCATHGAIYAPDTGKCVGGPCRGGRLRALQVDERDTPEGRAVFWLPDGELRPATPLILLLFDLSTAPHVRQLTPEPKEPSMTGRPRRLSMSRAGSAPRSSASRSRRSPNSARHAAGKSSSALCSWSCCCWRSGARSISPATRSPPPGVTRRWSTLDGEISADTNANAEDINSALESAFDDAGTAGVILRCNSPGGSPVQAGIIYHEIRRLRAKYPSIPLYVVVGDMCASGGYYAAAAADKITWTRRASSARSAC